MWQMHITQMANKEPKVYWSISRDDRRNPANDLLINKSKKGISGKFKKIRTINGPRMSKW